MPDGPTGPTGPAAGPPDAPAAASADARADVFRPDLEGLRGVAILLVLAFHAGGPAPGGFIGVDAFFVLSGFLITGLLLREHERDGRIDLVRFYARRARRILPAALVVIVGTLVASAVVLAPIDLPRIAGDAAATALWAGNLRFAIDATDYFGAVAPSPLLHYWSLGVEEQFYLVWPALMIMATAAARPIAGARLLIGGVLAASLLTAIALTEMSGPWAFYSLPSRAWQLAIGGLLAATLAWQARLPGWLAAGIGWAGLAAIVGSALAIDAAVPYPGTAALVPTVGAAAVILSGPRRRSPGAVLAVAPLRFLGRISFSLYLVHWPIFVLPAATLALDEELPPEVRAGLAALSILVATALHLVVEQPFHRGRRITAISARRTLAGAGAGVAVVAIASIAAGSVAAGLLPGGSGGIGGLPGSSPPPAIESPVPTEPPPTERPPTRPTTGSATPEPNSTPAPPTPMPVPTGPTALTPDVRPALADARTDVERIQADGCNLLYAGTEPPDCVYGSPDGEVTIALVGDSHAAHWFPAAERIAVERGWRLVPFTKVSCRFVDLPILSRELAREYTECATWRERVVERLIVLRPDIVIVASARGMAVTDPADEDPTRQGEAMARLLARVPGEIVILADTPQSIHDVPACISRNLADVTVCETPIDKAFNWRRLRLERAAADASGATLVDLSDWICPAERCPVVMNGLLVYRDVHHMTATFATSLAGPLYRALPELP